MSTSALSPGPVTDVLRELCARNTMIQITWPDIERGCEVHAKARCLEMVEDGLVVSEPSQTEKNRRIPLSRPISVQFGTNQKFFMFSTIVLQDNARVRLNEQQRVRGILLQTPDAIEPFQRRSHFRVSMIGSNKTVVQLARKHPDHDDACAMCGNAGQGALLNLSGGGAALLIDNKGPWKPKQADSVFLSFVLPDSEEELYMFGVVRFLTYLDRQDSYRVGFEFLPWSGQDFDRCRRDIMKATAHQERLRLQRRR